MCIGKEETQGASHQKHNNNNNKTKKGYICWTPYLHGKFLRALEILGEGNKFLTCNMSLYFFA